MKEINPLYAIDGRPRLIAVGFAADDALLTCARREPGLRFSALTDVAQLGQEGQGGPRVQASDLALLSAPRLGRNLLRSVSLLRAIAPGCRIVVADAAGPAGVATMACGADVCISSSVSAREFGAIVQLLLDPPRPGRSAPPAAPGTVPRATSEPPLPPAPASFVAEPFADAAGAGPIEAGSIEAGALAAMASAAPPAQSSVWRINRERGALASPEGVPVWLTPKEAVLMNGLCMAVNQVLTRDHWLHTYDKPEAATEAVRNLRAMELAAVVSRFKRKVAVRTGIELPIRTLRGVGYQFMAELLAEPPPPAADAVAVPATSAAPTLATPQP